MGLESRSSVCSPQVAGLVFLFGSPLVSLVVLAILLALYVILTGVLLIALALAVRKATTALAEL